ncbi:MAG: hypothetical protein WAN65_31960 [Candidatus Sulfotelmatobacter sp.]
MESAMSETHDQDDLPPKKDRQHIPTLGFIFGEVTGSVVWIAVILLLAAGVAWLAIRSMS